MSTGGPTVVVVGAGYEGKRRYYQRLAALGARLVIVDEPGHWSQSLADEIAGTKWVATPVSGNPDTDTGAILGALERSGVRAHGVLTFFENYVREAARVAAALGAAGQSAGCGRRGAQQGPHPGAVRAAGAAHTAGPARPLPG